jgi:Fe-Mn family superoxide dismutase
MTTAIAAFDGEPGQLDGLSERLIVSHYENNYGGAVRRLNAIEAELAKGSPATMPPFLLNGLKREELVAANSTVLHELYFAALGSSGEPSRDLVAALARSFGGVDTWRAEFTAMGKALGGGSGWVLLTWSPRDGRLVNQWASDHGHTLADGRVVLALDMYEHAYHMDYGANAGGYVDAFMRNINWAWVGARLAHVRDGAAMDPSPYGAHSIAPERLREMIGASPPLVLDVRRRKAFEAGRDMLVHAEWREPESVESWAATMPRDRPIVVYCVYGHNVSADCVVALRKAGCDARALRGGIAAWHAIAGPVIPRTGGTP